jgi:hypothetical protein
VRSASNGVDAADRGKALPGPWIRIFIILGELRELLHGSRSKTEILASSLAGVRTGRGAHSLVPYVLHFLLHGDCSSRRNTLASG